MAQRNICNNNCTNYDGLEETMLHTLRDSKVVRNIWMTLVYNNQWEHFFTLVENDWWNLNLNRNMSQHENKDGRKVGPLCVIAYGNGGTNASTWKNLLCCTTWFARYKTSTNNIGLAYNF